MQRTIEQVLGFRIVRVGTAHTYTTGVQIQHLDSEGKVVRVEPSTARMLKMFEMLCGREP